MPYQKWFEEHAKKHKLIVDKLLCFGYSEDKIIDYFDFENMVLQERDFCPLYEQNKKCHETEELNCYFCACPNFRFNDNGIEKIDEKIKYSFCYINSKDAKLGIYGDAIHQDCSGCIIPHKKNYIQNNFHYDWSVVMKECKYGKFDNISN